MIPFSITGRTTYRAYGTFTLIFVYALFFLWEIHITSQAGQPIENLIADYALLTCNVATDGVVETTIDGIRSLFLHETFAAFALNMLFLWVFGSRVEEFTGARRFILFFLLAGIGGNAFSILLSGTCVTLYGPAGAIAGVLGAFILLYPHKRVIVQIGMFGRSFDLPAMFFLIVYLALQIFASEGGPLSGVIAPYWDEIGGLLTGLGIIFVGTLFKPAPRVDAFEYLDD